MLKIYQVRKLNSPDQFARLANEKKYIYIISKYFNFIIYKVYMCKLYNLNLIIKLILDKCIQFE